MNLLHSLALPEQQLRAVALALTAFPACAQSGAHDETGESSSCTVVTRTPLGLEEEGPAGRTPGELLESCESPTEFVSSWIRDERDLVSIHTALDGTSPLVSVSATDAAGARNWVDEEANPSAEGGATCFDHLDVDIILSFETNDGATTAQWSAVLREYFDEDGSSRAVEAAADLSLDMLPTNLGLSFDEEVAASSVHLRLETSLGPDLHGGSLAGYVEDDSGEEGVGIRSFQISKWPAD